MSYDWNEALFEQVYERVLAMLCERRRRGESAQSIRDNLQWEYVACGVNWLGKGQVWHVTQEATIAAYETFLSAWEEELRHEDHLSAKPGDTDR